MHIHETIGYKPWPYGKHWSLVTSTMALTVALDSNEYWTAITAIVSNKYWCVYTITLKYTTLNAALIELDLWVFCWKHQQVYPSFKSVPFKFNISHKYQNWSSEVKKEVSRRHTKIGMHDCLSMLGLELIEQPSYYAGEVSHEFTSSLNHNKCSFVDSQLIVWIIRLRRIKGVSHL